jgi:hypothetical protein
VEFPHHARVWQDRSGAANGQLHYCQAIVSGRAFRNVASH